MDRHDLITAITACGHSIDHDEVTLRYDPRQEGHNAFNQLNRRITAWAEEREAEVKARIEVCVDALEACKEMATVMEAFTSSRSDDDWVWGLQRKIDAALSQAKGETP